MNRLENHIWQLSSWKVALMGKKQHGLQYMIDQRNSYLTLEVTCTAGFIFFFVVYE
jgi:hypothetical protein